MIAEAFGLSTSADNVSKTPPGGVITEVIDNGTAHSLVPPMVVATDASGNVYVAGSGSDNAF